MNAQSALEVHGKNTQRKVVFFTSNIFAVYSLTLVYTELKYTTLKGQIDHFSDAQSIGQLHKPAIIAVVF